MEKQLQANHIRIGVLEQENMRLRAALAKVKAAAQQGVLQVSWGVGRMGGWQDGALHAPGPPCKPCPTTPGDRFLGRTLTGGKREKTPRRGRLWCSLCSIAWGSGSASRGAEQKEAQLPGFVVSLQRSVWLNQQQ